jgi:hypothetical protein
MASVEPYIALKLLRIVPQKVQHLLKLVPPALTERFASEVDELVWSVLMACATPSGRPDPAVASAPRIQRANTIAQLPEKYEGLGFTSVVMLAPICYLSSLVTCCDQDERVAGLYREAGTSGAAIMRDAHSRC